MTMLLLRATTCDELIDTSNEDKAQRSVLHRVVHHHSIAAVVRFPHRLRKRKAVPTGFQTIRDELGGPRRANLGLDVSPVRYQLKPGNQAAVG